MTIAKISTDIHNLTSSQNMSNMIKHVQSLVPVHHNYIGSNDSEYWRTHGEILDALDFHLVDKNSSILDFGTQFGFLPWMLKEFGFTNVHSCNSMDEAGTHDELNTVWNFLDIKTPFDLTVMPNISFTLPQKYDIIFVFKSNMFWLLNDVFCYKRGEITKNWQVTDDKGEVNTFFSVYNKSQYEYFENNIKKFLNPGGIAVVQPDPFVYNTFPERFSEEKKWFSERQQTGYVKVSATHHYPNNENSDYFIIRKDG